MTKRKQEDMQEAKGYLKDMRLYNGKITIVIKSVSSNGMYRRMRVYTKTGGDITHLVARAIDWTSNDKGIGVGGCGMDMAFHLADTLTWALYGNKRKTMKSLKGNGSGCINWTTL